MKAFFKNANVMYNPAIRTIFEAIGYLSDEGYKDSWWSLVETEPMSSKEPSVLM